MGRANPFSPSLPLPELANPCAKDSLEDLKPTNPFLFTDITCSPDAMSPGSSDVSGQWFHPAESSHRAGSAAGTTGGFGAGTWLTPGAWWGEKQWETPPGANRSRAEPRPFAPPGPAMSHSPNSQDSGGSDLDLDPVEAKLFPDGELRASPLGREGRACASHLGTSPEHPSALWDFFFFFFFLRALGAILPIELQTGGKGQAMAAG